MKLAWRSSRLLTVMLFVGSAALVGAPPTAASAAPQPKADASLPAPVLTSATRQRLSDGAGGDEVRLLWQQSAGSVHDYAVYANDRFVLRTPPGDAAMVLLASEGLNGSETFTVRAEAGVTDDGTPIGESPDSNGLTATVAVELRTPVLKTAVLDSDARTVTLTWTPSSTTEISGHVIYEVYATPIIDLGTAQVASVQDSTSAVVSLDQNFFTLTGSEQYYVVARDRTFFNQSQPRNRLVPTS